MRFLCREHLRSHDGIHCEDGIQLRNQAETIIEQVTQGKAVLARKVFVKPRDCEVFTNVLNRIVKPLSSSRPKTD